MTVPEPGLKRGAAIVMQIRDHMDYLTTEQAMADYAGLIMELKAEFDPNEQIAIVGFGGSYGGMLGSWFRMKVKSHFACARASQV
eukprot:354731-Chlamydomonas_euryale.AAC.5